MRAGTHSCRDLVRGLRMQEEKVNGIDESSPLGQAPSEEGTGATGQSSES